MVVCLRYAVFPRRLTSSASLDTLRKGSFNIDVFKNLWPNYSLTNSLCGREPRSSINFPWQLINRFINERREMFAQINFNFF